jgi:hypothetical protein
MPNREELLSQIESERESYEQQALGERGSDEVLATPNPGVIVIPAEGAYKFPMGLSGSLTKLTNGDDYLVAGSNIALSTGSAGNITISSTFQTWGSYTPVVTGAVTNPTPPEGTNLVGTYVVQGKTMTLNFNLSCAVTTGAGAGSGIYTISMPPGYTIDTNYAALGTSGQSYNDGSPLGMSVLLADIAGTGGAWAVIPVSTTGLVLIGQNPAVATGTLVWGSANFPLGVATNYRVSFIASIPVV